MASIGLTHVKDSGTFESDINGPLTDSSSKDSGNSVVFGGTVGIHFHCDLGRLIGVRVGYSSQTVKLGDINYKAQGLLLCRHVFISLSVFSIFIQ